MATYIGKRIVPVHCGKWEKNRSYEMLSIVLEENSGDSYIARRMVPAGTDISDTYYWMLHSLYSQQIKDMSDQLAATEERIAADNDETEASIKADNRTTRDHVDESLQQTTRELTERVTNAQTAMTQQKASFDEQAAQLNERMDAVLAAGTGAGDTEIIDARMDADGIVHPTLGSSIRESVQSVRNQIRELNGPYSFSDHMIAFSEMLWKPGYCLFESGEVSGEATDPNWFITDYVSVDKDTRITANIIGYVGVATISAYNANKEYMKDKSIENSFNDTYVVPDGVKYLRFSSMIRYLSRIVHSDSDLRQSGLVRKIEQFDSVISAQKQEYGAGLLNDYDIIHLRMTSIENPMFRFRKRRGFLQFSNGLQTENDADFNWSVTGYIPVIPGSTLSYNTFCAPVCATIAFYDSSLMYLPEESIRGGDSEKSEDDTHAYVTIGEVVVPENAAYMRVCSGYSYKDLCVEFDTSPSYAAYIEKTSELGKLIAESVQADAEKLFAVEEALAKVSEEISGIDVINGWRMQRQITISMGYDGKEKTYGYINPSGVLIGDGIDTNWVHTDYIMVMPGTEIEYSLSSVSNLACVSFYDGTKKALLESIIEKPDSPSGTVIVPDDAVYARFCSSPTEGKYAKFYAAMSIYEYACEVNDRIADVESEVAELNDRIESLQEQQEELSQTKEKKTTKIGYKYDVNHFLCYGQSLSQGDWATYVVSTFQKYNSLMFEGTMRTWEYRDQENRYRSLVPAVEKVFKYQDGETRVGATVRAETPCCGAADMIVELAMKEDSVDAQSYRFQMLMSAPGMGGASISSLGNTGGSYYQRLLDDVRNGKRLAEEDGKSYSCNGMMWIQGESDNGNSFDAYYNAMKTMFSNLNRDIKGITGQKEDVHFFLYQMCCYDWYSTGFHYPEVPLAQLQLSLEMENVHMASPIYFMDFWTDWCHLTPEASKLLGAYMGIAWKRVVIDGYNFQPIHVTDWYVSGNNIYLQFYAPKYPLVLDTENAVDRGISKGFQIREMDDYAQNSYLDIIENVEVIRDDMIKITCSEKPTGKKLTYAINGTATPGNRKDFGSGNLRDSQDITFSFATQDSPDTEVEHVMYNWCPLFELVLQ